METRDLPRRTKKLGNVHLEKVRALELSSRSLANMLSLEIRIVAFSYR